MSLLEKHLESIIIERALALFFYNFNTYPEIVEEMKKENGGFKNEWEKLYQASRKKSKKTGWMATIEYTDIYGLYVSKLTYNAQALLLDKVLLRYEKQARHDIEFAMEMDVKVEEVRRGRGDVNK